MSHPLPPPFDELWATHEFFRRCGFAPAQIFILFDREGGVGVVLRHAGREFVVAVARSIGEHTAFEERWSALVERINSGEVPDADLERAWRTSDIYARKIGCLAALISKGIHPVRGLD